MAAWVCNVPNALIVPSGLDWSERPGSDLEAEMKRGGHKGDRTLRNIAGLLLLSAVTVRVQRHESGF